MAEAERAIAKANAAFDRVFSDATNILAAVSGGPDSVALLALLADWAKSNGRSIRVFAATVDHGLRPESAQEAADCGRLAAQLGIPHAVLRWEDPKPATGLQESARIARYGLLAAHARSIGATHVATAHHADDQAETVLMRLAAGSGIAGLAAMRETTRLDGLTLARPLLAFGKADLESLCVARGLAVVRDPSNTDAKFGRVRARAALTALAREGLTVGRLARLANRAARADEALAQAAAESFGHAILKRSDCLLRLDWSRLADKPEEIRLRALALAVSARRGADEPGRLEVLEALLSAVDEAAAAKRRLRRSVGDQLVTLQSGGVLTIGDAPPRRRGTAAG